VINSESKFFQPQIDLKLQGASKIDVTKAIEKALLEQAGILHHAAE
jgi:hypothetical protein